MSRFMARMRRTLLVLMVVLLLAISGASAARATPKHLEEANWCPNSVFVFGDSLSDTGNLHLSDPLNPAMVLSSPYGTTYFNQPAGRYSDGRLVNDLLVQALGFPFLPPIQEVQANASATSKHGVNFAYAGATARCDARVTPYHLHLQVAQFLDFKKSNGSSTSDYFPSTQDFMDGMYILHVGGNDFFYAYLRGATPTEVKSNVVPESVGAILSAIRVLYNNGARSFFVFNNPPQGCAPIVLTTMAGPDAMKDEFGCLKDFNAVVQEFNENLKAGVESLRQDLAGVNIYLGDYYNINYDIIKSPELYGFSREGILKASCGVGGPYNYNPTVTCGHSGALPDGSVVNLDTTWDPSQYIYWDGVHFTEAYYKIVATAFLAGNYVTPSMSLGRSCQATLAA